MTFTISADDPRTIRAIEIAADADDWLRYRDGDGEEAYGVPSQGEPGRRYFVTPSTCDCADFRRNDQPAGLDQAAEARACKHILAVRLYRELLRAQSNAPRLPARVRQRGHLSLVPTRAEAEAAPPAS